MISPLSSVPELSLSMRRKTCFAACARGRRRRVDARKGFGRRGPCVQELASKLFDFLLRRLPLRLAGRGALLELVRERLLDALLPFVRVNGAVVVRVHLREGGLEPRRDQQVLEVLVAAVGEELDNLLCA